MTIEERKNQALLIRQKRQLDRKNRFKRRIRIRYEDLLGEFVCIGVPRYNNTNDAFTYYGYLSDILPNAYVIKHPEKPLTYIEKSKVMFVRKTNYDR